MPKGVKYRSETMTISMAKRNAMRRLQDQVIRLAEGRGYGDAVAVSADLPHVTLGDLRTTIYPQYEGEISGILGELLARSK
jgi:hypothetical protein